MQPIYMLLSNFINVIIALTLYNQITKSNLKRATFCFLPPIYVAYRFLTLGVILDPFRTILSFLLLGILLLVFEKKTLWVSLLVVFAITYILSLFNLLLATITIVILNTHDEFVFLFIGLIYPLIVLLSILVLEKRDKTLLHYSNFLESPLIRKIILIIGILVIALYSFVELSNSLRIEDFRTSLAIWTAFVSIILIIMLLIIFGTSHLKNEQKAMRRLEEENEQVIQEHLIVQKQLSELNLVYTELQKDFGSLTSSHHNYKYLIPIVINMQHKLITELHTSAEQNHEEKVERLKNYTDSIRAFSFQLNDELISDHISSEISKLNISEDYFELKVLLETLMNKAQKCGIYLSTYNYSNAWNGVDDCKIIFLRLLSNLVDNAIKESYKLSEAERGEIKIIFKEEDGYFGFEVRDGAPEFELFVLKNIGTRKISTNGTGDGYAEIMMDLKKIKASFVLKEWQINNTYGKAISVIFDGYEMRLLDSHYRHELLKTELTKSEFEIMDIY